MLVGGVVGLAACRQPNPDWQGPDDPSTSSPATTATTATTAATAATATGADEDASGPTTSGPSTGSSTGADDLGQSCNNDNMCSDGLVCGPDGVCQAGGEGDPCVSDADCQPPTPQCSPSGECQAGTQGDPCANNSDCADGLTCMTDRCG